jgi:hypothetical protein
LKLPVPASILRAAGPVSRASRTVQQRRRQGILMANSPSNDRSLVWVTIGTILFAAVAIYVLVQVLNY